VHLSEIACKRAGALEIDVTRVIAYGELAEIARVKHAPGVGGD
jgi:hypothetical protein